MTTTAHTVQSAMVELRTGKITPDQFRTIMRELRPTNQDKAYAVALDQRNPYGTR